MNNLSISETIQTAEQYRKMLDGNKRYVEKKLNIDSDYFKRLSMGQHPKFLLIGCSDSRAPPNEITSTNPGDIFIHRNIANVVIPSDLNLNCVIEYAVNYLKVTDIVVMGHTQCGGVKAALSGQSSGGLLDVWLNEVKLVYDINKKLIDSIDDQTDRVDCLCCMNVRSQVSNIWKNPTVQQSWANGHQIVVHGWIYHMETGYILQLTEEDDLDKNLDTVFKIAFPQNQHPENEMNQLIGIEQ